jgi:hypothetical protein
MPDNFFSQKNFLKHSKLEWIKIIEIVKMGTT